MRIMMYLPHMLLDGALGATTHPRELITHLSACNNNIAVITGLYDQKKWKEMNPHLATYCVRRPDIRLIGYSIALAHGFIIALQIMKRQEFDIIYTRNGPPFPLASMLSKITRIPLVREVNGVVIEEIGIEFPKSCKWLVPLYSLTEYIENKSSAHIIAVTENIRSELIRLYGVSEDRITVIQNGANTNLFRPLEKTKARTLLGLDLRKPCVCWVGSMVGWQGLDDLILSIPDVLADHQDTCFLMVGDGPFLEKAKELVKKLGIVETVIFTGLVDYQLVPIYMNSADCCVVCKKKMRSGYSPLKLYEYMACAKPVVAPRLSGFEVVESEGAGVLYESGNPRSLAEAISYVLSMDESMRKRMGKNGLRLVNKYYNYENIAEKTMVVFSEIKGSIRK